MTDVTFDDLVDGAGDAAAEATAEQGTGEWVTELVQTLDKRGLLEPILFGPDGTAELREQRDEQREQATDAGDGDGAPDLDADGVSNAGKAIMDQLGNDVTVAEVVDICEANPDLVNQQLDEHL